MRMYWILDVFLIFCFVLYFCFVFLCEKIKNIFPILKKKSQCCDLTKVCQWVIFAILLSPNHSFPLHTSYLTQFYKCKNSLILPHFNSNFTRLPLPQTQPTCLIFIISVLALFLLNLTPPDG